MGTTGQSITLANSVIGVGILAMPFCFQQCGVLLATLILILMGFVSRLSCYFLLKSALMTKRRNFEFLAFHVFGPAGKLAVEVGIIGFLMGTCIAYFVVVGDLGPQIVAKMFNINQSDMLRTSIMVIVSLVCVLPLGLLRNVDSLSNVSAATIGFYLCLVIKLIFEAASQLFNTDWYNKIELWKPSGVLQCVPIFSMALFCQTQLFEIFESLPTLSMEKMSVVTKNAINICTSVYFTLGLFGYIAFCSQQISGNILVSLSPTMASDVIKLGFVMSLAFSFPLIIFPCRASLYSFLYKKVHAYHHEHLQHAIPSGAFRCLTVGIVGAALVASLLLPDIELVLGLLGATVGVLVCVVCPAACFVRLTHKDTNERLLAKILLVLGLGIMVLGTYANLQAAEYKPDRYDDKITQERIDKIVEDFFESKKIIDKPEDTILKPLAGNHENLLEKKVNIIPEIIKDSEVQPPNPIPPESVSNEKHEQKIPEVKLPENKQLKELLPDDKMKVLEIDDKVSETHPNNLNNKLTEIKASNDNKVQEIKPEVSQPSPQEKIDLIKQNKLIETIKQHGEEQKELIKEQKEILSELKKTQEEIKQNKKEVDSSEAKKIAVESIQKIANMAIQSLSGVSDMPDAPVGKPLEKTANEAVQQIAKKAVETIEAIKETNKKPKATVQIKRIDLPNVQNNAPNVILNEPVPIVQANAALPSNSVQQNIPLQNAKINQGNIQSIHNIPQQNENINQPQNSLNFQQNKPLSDQQMDPINKSPQNGQVLNKAPKQNSEASKPVANKLVETNKILQNGHSHSPDEPQSYKEGEDAQKNTILNNIAHNVPLPLAINGNAENIVKSQINKQPEAIKPKSNSIVENNQVPENADNVQNNIPQQPLINNFQANNNQPIRQKREVVDCTQKTTLKPEDKAICTSLLNNNSEEILKKIDLNDNLLRNGPLHDGVGVHHIRSLKSFDETKE